MRINLLEPEIYNRIAAGEVVDRPRSVVKELFENAIDAGATSVTVEILRGGLDMIKVTDNGHGIERQEMPKVFLAHATSKIRDLSDLGHIKTLGFRGEAIASITSVSRVTVLSRTADSDLGYYMVYENGKKIDEGEKGCPIGTSVTVEQLFENIPARKKFLKVPRSEEADITSLVSKLILVTPKVAVKYLVNGKNVYSSSGEGLESAMICVYGREMMYNLMFISIDEPDLKISGFVNKPAYSKHNKAYQTIALNGRYIINDEIGYAVFYAYKDYLMTRQFPVFTLFVDLPCDMVDVNVHPGKMEVKFVQPERIRGVLKRAIEEKIKEYLNIPAAVTKKIENADTDIFDEEPIKLFDKNNGNEASKSGASTSRYAVSESEVKSFSTKGGGIKIGESPYSSFVREVKPINPDRYVYGQENCKKIDAIYEFTDVDEKVGDLPLKDATENLEQISFASDISEKVNGAYLAQVVTVGKLFNTYLLLQRGDELLLIDQHAAHERILYDKLKTEIDESNAVQELLVPYIFDTTFSESEILSEHAEILKNCGFEIDSLSGDAYSLRSIPACLSQMNLQVFVSDLLSVLKNGRIAKSDFIKSTVMQTACKAAVKANMDLSEFDVDYILEKLASTNELFCPHGRPIVIKITKTELEKWFKRIV